MRSNWWIPCFPSHLNLWLYGHVHIAINIGDFSIGEFLKKIPIANKSSCTVCPIAACFFKIALLFFLLYIDGISESTSSAAVVPCTEDHVVLVVS